MAITRVVACGLDPMADGVAEIEDMTQAGIPLVSGNDCALVAGAGEDNLVESQRVDGLYLPHSLPKRTARQQRRLDHLDEARRKLLSLQRHQGARVRDHSSWQV